MCLLRDLCSAVVLYSAGEGRHELEEKQIVVLGPEEPGPGAAAIG